MLGYQMRRFATLVLLLLAALPTSGCQCCPGIEVWNDCVDHIADHPCRLDALYHPSLDATRINRVDGLQCCGCKNKCPPECRRCRR